jgi:fumarate reductase subunit C
VSRRNAVTLGVVLWAVSLLWATTFDEVTPKAMAIWALASAVVVAAAILAARTASRALRNAVEDDT